MMWLKIFITKEMTQKRDDTHETCIRPSLAHVPTQHLCKVFGAAGGCGARLLAPAAAPSRRVCTQSYGGIILWCIFLLGVACRCLALPASRSGWHGDAVVPTVTVHSMYVVHFVVVSLMQQPVCNLFVRQSQLPGRYINVICVNAVLRECYKVVCTNVPSVSMSVREFNKRYVYNTQLLVSLVDYWPCSNRLAGQLHE